MLSQCLLNIKVAPRLIHFSPASSYPKTRRERKIEQLIVATGKLILSLILKENYLKICSVYNNKQVFTLLIVLRVVALRFGATEQIKVGSLWLKNVTAFELWQPLPTTRNNMPQGVKSNNVRSCLTNNVAFVCLERYIIHSCFYRTQVP